MNVTVESNVWGDILHALKSHLNQQTLETWFRPIRFERVDSQHQNLCLRAPNHVVKDWVISNYSGLLNQSLNELQMSGYSVDWVIEKPAKGSTPPADELIPGPVELKIEDSDEPSDLSSSPVNSSHPSPSY